MLKLRIVLDYFVIRRTVNGTDSDLFAASSRTRDHGERLMQYEAMLHVSTPAYEWIQNSLRTNTCTVHQSSPDAAHSLLNRLKRGGRQKHKNKSSRPPGALRCATVDRYWFWRLDYYSGKLTPIRKEPTATGNR